ncbi:MAG: DUF554 domain-containing protein [Kiritimatiellae bacterium]|nr:DUF554 domain-containing protein [Kiritimatiellia bacterium]
MTGIGSIVNAGAIIAGGLVGLAVGSFISKRVQATLVSGMAVGTLFIGAGSTFSKMLVSGEGGSLESRGALMLVISLAVGAVAGELLDIDGKMERFGEWLKRVSHNERDGSFLDAFVTASLTFCIGAMAILGALEDGLKGDPSLLYLKSVMDGIFTIALTASLGKGVLFSAIPILLFQGSITLASSLLRPIMTPEVLDAISLVGGVLIFCVGWNILWHEKKIRVANLLPALVVAVVWTLVVTRGA